MRTLLEGTDYNPSRLVEILRLVKLVLPRPDVTESPSIELRESGNNGTSTLIKKVELNIIFY